MNVAAKKWCLWDHSFHKEVSCWPLWLTAFLPVPSYCPWLCLFSLWNLMKDLSLSKKKSKTKVNVLRRCKTIFLMICDLIVCHALYLPSENHYMNEQFDVMFIQQYGSTQEKKTCRNKYIRLPFTTTMKCLREVTCEATRFFFFFAQTIDGS